MTALTISFPRKHVEAYEPNPEVVDLCERLLDYARKGELRALAVAIVYSDDLSPAGETTAGFAVTSGTYFAVTHALAGLVRKWGAFCDKRAGMEGAPDFPAPSRPAA